MGKILFTITTLNRGGAERVICNLANYFCSQHEVIVITDSIGENEYELDSHIKRINLDQNSYQCSGLQYFFISFFKIKKIIKKEKPDRVVSFMGLNNIRTILAAKIEGIQVYFSVRCAPEAEYHTFLRRICAQIVFMLADGGVFQTVEELNFFNNVVRKKSRIIMNPINEKFNIPRFKGEREKRIVAVGRLTSQKNYAFLIRSFKKFHENHPDYRLEIYGQGEDKNKLETLVDNILLSKNVKFMGIVNDVEKKIYNAAMYIMSSDYEGLPNALMEAMALGIPVISTDCIGGGPRMLIKNRCNGILVTCGDENMLSDAMCELVENPVFSQKLGIEAEKIKISCSLENICIKWKEFLLL